MTSENTKTPPRTWLVMLIFITITTIVVGGAMYYEINIAPKNTIAVDK